MSARHPHRWRIWLAAVGLTLVRCGSSSGPAAEVIYEGSATDEVYGVMVDDLPGVMVDDANAARFAGPAENAVLPAATPASFSWIPGFAGRSPARPRPPVRPGAGPFQLFGEGVAEAHRPPITATVYLLTFSWAGAAKPLVVLTSNQSYLPDAAAWARLAAASGPIQLELIAAHVTQNVIDRGPYQASAPLTFSIR